MDVEIDVLNPDRVDLYRLSTKRYHQMDEAGIFGPEDRVELIDGQLVAMPTAGSRHALAVDALTEIFVLALAGRARVRVQHSVLLNDMTEPQPDLVLARPGWRGHPDSHPGPDDILLLVEVSDSTLAFDTGVKRRLYARAGVGEYWIVDLTRNLVHVHRAPQGGAYTSIEPRSPADTLDVAAFPDLRIEAASLFF